MNRVIYIFALVCIAILGMVACGDGGNAEDGDYPVYDGDTEDVDGDNAEVEIDNTDGDLDLPVDGDVEPELEMEAEPEIDGDDEPEIEIEAEDGDTEVEAEVEESAPQNPTGSFSLLSYNIQGQQTDLESSGKPLVNTPLIAPLLNNYDVVFLQEDIYYHYFLDNACTHQYRSVPDVENPDDALSNKGDGLNMFSNVAFSFENDFKRIKWDECGGFSTDGWTDYVDCIRNKGFSVVELTLDSGISLNIINLHLDQDGKASDKTARAAQINQIISYVKANLDVALIITGDFEYNAADTDDVDRMDFLKDEIYLEDACVTLNCTEDLPIKVLYRSSPEMTLTPELWKTPGEFINTANGENLSDRKPVNVNFKWERHLFD